MDWWQKELNHIIQDAPQWIQKGIKDVVTTEDDFGLFVGDALDGKDAFNAYCAALRRKGLYPEEPMYKSVRKNLI